MRVGYREQGAYPRLPQPQAAMVPLTAALAYIHQKFFVLTSAFQCDLTETGHDSAFSERAACHVESTYVHIHTL